MTIMIEYLLNISYLCCFFTSGCIRKPIRAVISLTFGTLIYVYPLKIHFHDSSCSITVKKKKLPIGKINLI